MRTFLKDHILLVLFLVFYFAITAYKFVTYPTPFYDWDEAINAQVGKEMLERFSLVPSWQYQTWLDKPPLAFLFYGLVMKIFPFVSPELSTRLATLVLTIITLGLVYILIYRASKDKLVALITVITTSFAPIFLQRAQITNLDVFVLLGWLGYVLFFENFISSLMFLAIAVLTKSLIGFYPVGVMLIYFIYRYLKKDIDIKKLKKVLVQMTLQVLMLSIWYIAMIASYKQDFINQHIIESHLKRVTASIESHFGKKTYYIDLIVEQLKPAIWFAVPGFFLFFFKNIKKYFTDKTSLYGFFLLPWFLFLNLTKTKIFWYIYPAIPQFAFFIAYPLTLLKKHRALYVMAGIVIVGWLIYDGVIGKNFFGTFYSRYDSTYALAISAKNNCHKITYLIEKGSRETTKTLESMNLTITTSTWWGNHPSIVYYSGKKVDFVYDLDKFNDMFSKIKIGECIILHKDEPTVSISKRRFKHIGNFETLSLFKRTQ